MKDLLQRYIQGDVSEDEKRAVMTWLEESPDNFEEFKAMRKLYDISLWNVSEQAKKKDSFRISPRQFIIGTLKVAAITVLVLFGMQKFVYSPKEDATIAMQSIHVPAGQRAELTLADGTHVWLNSRSTLKFPTQFGSKNRNVELDGEGYFTVTKDPSAPFIVKTNQYDIEVLGTEFNVKAYKQSACFETSLLKGSVEISSPRISRKVRLKPNEVILTQNNQVKIKQISDYNYFKWRDGLFCFENETVESLIEKLQLYYDVTIEVHRPTLLKHRYSGKFRIKDGIEHVLKVLQLKHKFTYTKNEEKNLIIIK